MPTLEITTMIGCPLRCTYCPQEQLQSAYGKDERYLSLENFELVLRKLPKFVRVDLSGMSEPWANPRASEMLHRALLGGFNVAIYTTLCGMHDYEWVLRLLDDYAHQVEVVVIHLPDKNGNMRGFKATKKYLMTLEAFARKKETGAKYLIDFMTMDKEHGVEPGLESWIDRHIETVEWTANSRAGSLDQKAIGAQPIEQQPYHEVPISCSFTPFYDHNVMFPNGDVVLCCMDYSMKHKLGNLFTDEYYDLFLSKELNELRVANMKRCHTDVICKKCTRARTYDVVCNHNQFWEVVP